MPVETRRWLINVSVLLTCGLITWTLLSFNIKKAITTLGLDKGTGKPVGAAIICTLPMFIGGWLYAVPNPDFGIAAAFEKAIWPGFNEELIFRGFIVGLLVRVARWAFIPAVLVSGFAFAWGHLYQANTAMDALLIFLVASGAGIGFAVFYWMWGWNLWFPMFMHMFMNLSFAMFDTGDNLLLNDTANIFRGITIGLAIIASVCIFYQDKKKQTV